MHEVALMILFLAKVAMFAKIIYC